MKKKKLQKKKTSHRFVKCEVFDRMFTSSFFEENVSVEKGGITAMGACNGKIISCE